MKRLIGLMTLSAGCLLPNAALAQQSAESWLMTVDARAAVPLNDPWGDLYGVGAMAGLGFYRSLSAQLLLGARLDAGMLFGEEIQGVEVDDLKIGALSAALRLRPLADSADRARGTGLHIELAGGVGVLDAQESDARPILQGGVSYLFDAKSLAIGPTARYVQAIVTDDVNDLRMLTAGVELAFLDPRGNATPRPTSTPPRTTRDEAYVDSGDEAAPAPANQNQGESRWIVDEKTFFDYDKSELRPEGKQKLDEIYEAYQAEGDGWAALKVQGHADNRGPEDYNRELSRERARSVRAYLMQKGIPGEKLDVEAYGEERPAIANADTEAEYQKNRRVEFVVVSQ